MIYLSSFKLSNKKLKNPNIYPYSVFKDKYIEPFSYAPITIFYGNNGCGKSTLLNIIAGKLKIKGKESQAIIMVQKIIVKDLKMNVPIVWEVMNTVFLFIIFLKIVVISKVKIFSMKLKKYNKKLF